MELSAATLELGCAALASLTSVTLGGLLSAGAIRAIASSAPARRRLQRRRVRAFVSRSEGGEEAWRQLVELAGAGDEAPLLARRPMALSDSLGRAAHRAFAAPSRYEALVRVLSHGASKDDIESVLGHEQLESLGSEDVSRRRAELRYRSSRRHLRARALVRLENLAAELHAIEGRAGVLAALAAAPWPSLVLLLGMPPAGAILAALASAASTVLGVRIAQGGRGGAD